MIENEWLNALIEAHAVASFSPTNATPIWTFDALAAGAMDLKRTQDSAPRSLDCYFRL
jgi:hypothetical protein